MKRPKITHGVILATVVLVCLFFGNLTAEKTVGLDQRSVDLATFDDDSDIEHRRTQDDEGFDVEAEGYDERFEDECDNEHEDREYELQLEAAELEIARNLVEHAVELASDEVGAAVYGIERLLKLVEPEVAKAELSQLLQSATNPTVKRAIQLGLLRVHEDLDDSQSAVDIAKQLVAAR